MDKKNKKKEKRSKRKNENQHTPDKSGGVKSKGSEMTFGLDLNYSNDIPLSMDDFQDGTDD